MSAFNALVDGGLLSAPDPGPIPTDNNAGATRGADMGPSPAQAAAAAAPNAAAVQGTPPIFGAHNTPLHVAFLGLIALGIIVLLRQLGFKFSVAGNLGLGR